MRMKFLRLVHKNYVGDTEIGPVCISTKKIGVTKGKKYEVLIRDKEVWNFAEISLNFLRVIFICFWELQMEKNYGILLKI
jgi:hypothetical protein